MILGCKLPEGATLRNYRALKEKEFRHLNNTAEIHDATFNCRIP
jgi:hypothetical protein